MGELRTELEGVFPFLVGLIAETEFESLAPYRGRAGWECCDKEEVEGQRWLRVPNTDEDIFALLPLLGRWTADSALMLYQHSHRVPERDLRSKSWEPLAKAFTILPPVRTGLGMQPFPIGFGLIKGAEFHEPSALLCSWGAFTAWCDQVLAPRIDCLHFALSSDGACLVSGAPHPALQGRGFYRMDGLWLPAGYRLPDFLWPELVRETLDLQSGETAVIFDNGDFDIIADRDWTAASRATLRVNEAIRQEEGLP